jgi:hypothetical protein
MTSRVTNIVTAYETKTLSVIEVTPMLVKVADQVGVDEVMRLAPKELVPSIRNYVYAFQPGNMISIGAGSLPSENTIACFRAWFETYHAIAPRE